ncbi:hypothetical protein ACN27F_00085 [Solwaraspora sp. WMMB335]|uniref:hypothetical protein n=1 Tax=Solwaraspora sp. WMMB335 TaxID=3404118 RepID=UPI003B941438
MPNPSQPGWQPEYTGGNSLGSVGSGRRLGAHLYYLYRAGRNELPEIAAVYARLTGEIHKIVAAMEAQFDRPGLGMESAHLRLLELRGEAHDVLRQTCLRMVEVGAALVQIADAYAATDQHAADEFSRMLTDNADDYRTLPPYVPEPPALHESPHSRTRDNGRPGGY